MLSYAAGREPKELDAARAAEIDRSLRITLLHPPHGRADLALTFTNTLHRLDRLHDIVAIVDTGLLPPLIGDVRLKPSPEKQGSE